MRVHATKFDGDGEEDDTEDTDKAVEKWSEKWRREGNGEWCYGKVTFVFRKKPRQPQKYRIKYHEGTVMESLETDIELAPEEEAEDETSSAERQLGEDENQLRLEDREEEPDEDDRHPLDREEETQGRDVADGNVELDSEEEDHDGDDETVTVGGVLYNVSANKRRRVTVGDGEGDVIPVGQIVHAGEYRWKRVWAITEDSRKEPHFETSFKSNLFHEDVTEVEVFRAFMPLDREYLLDIIRVNADEDGDKRVWEAWHVDAALAVLFGGAQFKEGTDLWATKRVGMMPPPDFGRQLSLDRFQRIQRYWGRGLPEERRALKQNPWAQIDPWVRGFNAARLREIKVGSCLTPDEMMFEWRGKSGYGGLPHMSYIKRKPKPLGTELKSVCEGTMGICVHLEIQKGKIAMARKKYHSQYGASTACTVRLCAALKLSDANEVPPLARCVFADSWFASVKTVLALRNELGLHFTGPVKTATANFPIEQMRHTLATMNRGEHIVLKCLDVPNLWAVGWHDHHFKCYVTSHGVTTPGKPAPKRRQDIDGNNFLKSVPRPHLIAKYQGEMGYVDRHNQFRQGYLHLPKIWKTNRWQTRIQFELLGLTMVDAFLACRAQMPKWQNLDDDKSIFWRFVHTVIGQIDPRPMSARVREGEEEDPTIHCKHVPLGQYRVTSGTYKGSLKSKQARCKYCPLRKRKQGESTVSPPTCYWCSFHEVAICRKHNCWERHLTEVTRNHIDGLDI